MKKNILAMFIGLAAFTLIGCEQKKQSALEVVEEQQDAEAAKRLQSASSYEPKEQQDFQKKITAFKNAKRGVLSGTREDEELWQRIVEFEKSVPKMQINNWVCEYSDISVWKAEDKGYEGQYSINCIALHSTLRGLGTKYSLNVTNPPSKIYRGDILKFSGVVMGGFRTNLSIGGDNFDMPLDQAQVEIIGNTLK